MTAFWTNHFTVSRSKASIAPGLAAYEREAIRPHVFGKFEGMLVAVIGHPLMLFYLDNIKSVGPNSDLTVIPMSASSMDARQAAKASQLVKRMAKTFKIDLPYVFAFCRTKAAIMTREHKGIISQLEAHDEPVLSVDLKERSAYRAIFTEGATVPELEENKSGSIAKAQTNAVAFTQAVLDYLAKSRSVSEAA